MSEEVGGAGAQVVHDDAGRVLGVAEDAVPLVGQRSAVSADGGADEVARATVQHDCVAGGEVVVAKMGRVAAPEPVDPAAVGRQHRLGQSPVGYDGDSSEVA